MRGKSKDDAAAPETSRVNYAFIRACTNGQELLALLGTGCEVGLVSEETARRRNLPVHFLAQSPRLRFADGRENARIGKATVVKCQFRSGMGTIATVRDLYSDRCTTTQPKECRGGPNERRACGLYRRPSGYACRETKREGTSQFSQRRSLHLSVLPTTLTSPNVSGVEPVPQRNEEITAPRQTGVAAEAGGQKHAPPPNGYDKGALLEDSLHLTPEEQQK